MLTLYATMILLTLVLDACWRWLG